MTKEQAAAAAKECRNTISTYTHVSFFDTRESMAIDKAFTEIITRHMGETKENSDSLGIESIAKSLAQVCFKTMIDWEAENDALEGGVSYPHAVLEKEILSAIREAIDADRLGQADLAWECDEKDKALDREEKRIIELTCRALKAETAKLLGDDPDIEKIAADCLCEIRRIEKEYSGEPRSVIDWGKLKYDKNLEAILSAIREATAAILCRALKAESLLDNPDYQDQRLKQRDKQIKELVEAAEYALSYLPARDGQRILGDPDSDVQLMICNKLKAALAAVKEVRDE